MNRDNGGQACSPFAEVDRSQVAVDLGPVDKAPEGIKRTGPTALAIAEPEVLLPDPTPRHEPSPVPRTSS